MIKNVSVFPPFTGGFNRQKANHGVFYEQFKVCRYNFSRGTYRRTIPRRKLNKMLLCLGMFEAKRRVKACRTELIHQRIYHNCTKERKQRRLRTQKGYENTYLVQVSKRCRYLLSVEEELTDATLFSSKRLKS